MEMRPEAKIQPKRWQMTGKKNKLLHATIEGYILRKSFKFLYFYVYKKMMMAFSLHQSQPQSQILQDLNRILKRKTQP